LSELQVTNVLLFSLQLTVVILLNFFSLPC
jgi:hypothetical protein